MQNNINLRVDINYDHDLHFTPISGPRGDVKRDEAKKYWLSLVAEFRIYIHNAMSRCGDCDEAPRSEQVFFVQRLPSMFENLKELLIVLVPERDQEEVSNNLDVDLLMQQVRNGVLDVVRLSTWLAKLLTTHCAPMRDEWAEEMAQKITEGATEGDMTSLVAGLEKLFSFLEAMKLDVANHQIRTFRIPLIEDTIAFQLDYFESRIADQKIDISNSRAWYRNMCQQHQLCPNDKGGFAPFESFLHGLAGLCAHNGQEIPETLRYDTSRLLQVQYDVQDIVHLCLCDDTFTDLVHRWSARPCNATLVYQALRGRILDLTDVESTQSVPEIWLDHVDVLAVEITRAAAAIAGRGKRSITDIEFRNTESQLRMIFTQEQTIHGKASILAKSIEEEAVRLGRIWWEKSPFEMSETQRQWQLTRQNKNGPRRIMPDLTDIARRLAHTGVVHWKVWANLAYLDERDEGFGVELGNDFNGGSCATASELVSLEHHNAGHGVLGMDIDMGLDQDRKGHKEENC